MVFGRFAAAGVVMTPIIRLCTAFTLEIATLLQRFSWLGHFVDAGVNIWFTHSDRSSYLSANNVSVLSAMIEIVCSATVSASMYL